MAMQAILCGELQQLRARFDRIDNMAKYRAKAEVFLSKDDRIDLDAFLQGVVLFNSPFDFPELFQKQIARQNTMESIALVQSRALEEKGGIASILSNEQAIIGMYNLNELEQYFFALENLLIENKGLIKENFTLNIENNDHSIIVSFDYGKSEWILVDANPHIPIAKTHLQIAGNLYQILGSNRADTSTPIVIQTQIFTVNETDNIALYQEVFKQWIEQTQAINQITEEKARRHDGAGYSLLEHAVHKGRLDLMEQLIALGADVKQMNPEKTTLLLIAIFNQQLDIIKFLLENGADLTETNIEGETVLHVAAITGNVDIFDFLLAREVNALQTSNDGTTPLLLAAQYGHNEILERLLKLQANPEQGNTYGHTPLHSAAKNNHLECIKRLVERGVDINLHGLNDETTALLIAAQSGSVESLQFLIENGADVNMACKQGITPLMVASNNGLLEIVKQLLHHKAKTNIANKHGITALYLASKYGFDEIIDILMLHGAKAEVCNANGHSPLTIASAQSHLESVKTLLARGADVNHPMSDGRSPLFLAAQNGHIEVVNELIKAGANPSLAWQTTKETFQQIFSDNAPHIIFRIIQFLDKANGDELNIHPLDIANLFNHSETAKLLNENTSSKNKTALEAHTFFNKNITKHQKAHSSSIPTQNDEASMAATSY